MLHKYSYVETFSSVRQRSQRIRAIKLPHSWCISRDLLVLRKFASDNDWCFCLVFLEEHPFESAVQDTTGLVRVGRSKSYWWYESLQRHATARTDAIHQRQS